MTPFTIGIIGIVVLFLLFLIRMPVGFAMGLVGFLGYSYLVNLNAGLTLAGQTPYLIVASYTFSVVPLFLLMGEFSFFAGLSAELYDFTYKWMGHLPGGLAMATIAACAGFAAISGSSTAGAVTMGTISLPEMKTYKYEPSLATGCVAAGGTLGILIPPSMIMIIYGIIAEQSIAKLFFAGFIPGFLLSALFMLTIYLLIKRNPSLAQRGEKSSWKDRMVGFKSTGWVLALFILIMGGMYAGIFTATEAGGVGAFGAFIIGVSRRKLDRQKFIYSLVDTGRTAGMLFIIVIGAIFFGYFLAVSRLPTLLAEFVIGLGLSRYVVLLIIFLVYLFLGCIMDGIAMILLTVPIFLPMIEGVGFDAIWFGIVVVLVVEMSLITPPVGLNVYVLSGVAKDVPMSTIFRGILPFLAAMIVCFLIVVAFPQIALWLPGLL